jgi:hypothetical protein
MTFSFMVVLLAQVEMTLILHQQAVQQDAL